MCCPDRFVRDRSTKAIVNAIGSDLDLYNELIEKFQDVNDPYILERVYAAAYGGVLRHKKEDSIIDLADMIYELEFKDNSPVEHLLTRDYARGIIEVASYQEKEYEVEMDKVRPPYESSSINVPSPDELRKLVKSRIKDSNIELKRPLWHGLAGLDFNGDGKSDFARYIVGTNINSDSGHGYNFSGNKALRWITQKVFDLGWHHDYFGKFVDFISGRSHGRMENRKPERFSKKYQWIAYY